MNPMLLKILRFFRLATALKLLLWLYFLRVPVIFWVVLLIAGPTGNAKASDFFSGLLFVPDPPHFFLLSMVSFLLAASCLASFNLIRAGSKERFHFSIPAGGDYWFFALAHAAPLVFLYTVVANTQSQRGHAVISELWLVVAGMGGYLVAFVVILISRGLQLWFADPKAPDPISLFLPGHGLFGWGRSLKNHRPGLLARPLRRAFEYVTRILHAAAYPLFQEGYDDTPKLGIAAGHIYATWIALVSLTIYLLLGEWRQYQIDPGSLAPLWKGLFSLLNRVSALEPLPAALPALAWVFFFVTMTVWVLSGVTYCIDRWRIPLFSLILVAIILTGGNSKTDNYYRSCPAGGPQANAERYPYCPSEDPLNEPRPKPRDLLQLRQPAGKLVLVSAPGGGIQSAAWTTFVLWKLDEASGGRLIPNVGAISSVSGGSVGIFHLAAAGFKAKQAFLHATQPTIDDVAWGYMVPDQQRIFLPYIRNSVIDRGWALECASERAAERDECRNHESPLNLDSPEIKPSANVPALIMNATMMERGGPIVFSTSEFLPPDPQTPNAPLPTCGPKIAGFGMQDFTELYGRRIRLMTAARLSASFPYVSPAARTFDLEPLCPDYHLQDGGYFDNYGIFSLITWLRHGLEPFGDHPPFNKILLIRLNAFPEGQVYPTVAGWRGQLVYPPEGFLHARDTAQQNAGDTAVEILSDQLKGQGIHLQPADFRYEVKGTTPQIEKACSNPPLNWVLTPRQKECFEAVWNANETLKGSRDAVVGYLK